MREEKKATLHIGIDADGVIFDLFRYQLEKGMEHFGKKEHEVDVEQYDIQGMFRCSYPERQWFWLLHIADYCMNSKLMDDACEMMKKWRDEGHRLYNITSRVFVANRGPLGALFRKMLYKRYEKEGIVFDQIEYCSETESARDKMLACHKHQIDIMLEDKMENIVSISQITEVLCFDAPYNRGIGGDRIARVGGFREADRYIQALCERRAREQQAVSFIVDGKFKKLTARQEALLPEALLNTYYRQRKEYYRQLPHDADREKRQERNFLIAHRLLVPALSLYFGPKIINRSNIPYQNGLIFVSNHLGSWDQFPLLEAIGRRPVHFLVASTLLKMKRGWLYKHVGSVFVDRNSARSRVESLEELTRIVSNNGNIFIFPEGTRNYDPNTYMLDFHPGPVTIAQITGAPIIPFAIHGRFTFRSRNLMVRVGEPMIVRPGEDLKKANQRLRDTVATLLWENLLEERKMNEGKKVFPVMALGRSEGKGRS